nr:MAG TPA: hypothetical protein [Caudoviricetes sp.]
MTWHNCQKNPLACHVKLSFFSMFFGISKKHIYLIIPLSIFVY